MEMMRFYHIHIIMGSNATYPIETLGYLQQIQSTLYIGRHTFKFKYIFRAEMHSYWMEPALLAILGHRSAHSLATGPRMAEPFISPLLLTITPALSSKKINTLIGSELNSACPPM